MKKIKVLLSVFVLSAVLLAGCSTGTKDDKTPEESTNTPVQNEHEMVHDESGEIPEGLKEAENPKYKVGDKVKITTDHMEGMEGAEATIVGAFDTVAYEISYDPTNGEKRVENHKWVIHEEIKDSGDKALEPGDEVTIEAKHMEGMEGATAIIDSAEDTTVYMIDYQPTTGGKEVKNHKWVTDEEVTAE